MSFRFPGSRAFAALYVYALSFVCPSFAFAQHTPVQEAIARRIDQIRADAGTVISGQTIAAVRVIPEFYAQRDHRPAWTNDTNVADLLRSIQMIELDGLRPSDYHQEALTRQRREIDSSSSPNPRLKADFDLLLTDALLRLTYHIGLGKVDPERLDPNWNLSRDLDGLDPVIQIENIMASGALYDFIESVKPQRPIYAALRSALSEHLQIRDAGGWSQVPGGAALKPGATNDQVPFIRNRLVRSGDLDAGAQADSRVYDDGLVDAVERFQQRHLLSVDGVVGNETRSAMNVSVEERIDQLRVNLERARWVLHDLDDRFIVVNIAEFTLRLVDERSVVWTARSQVGKLYRKTPVFKAPMKYLVFNPTWTVPPTILKNDVLPAIRKDPSYLQRKNMAILDHDGNRVDPGRIDWNALGGRFPYIVRQGPGLDNALGLVKFIFPNEHFVFVHDTPSKALFDREQRTFSSGCIRVENPFDLAALLLADQEGWDREAIDALVASGETKTVYLKEPLPVLVLYWTVTFAANGDVQFLPDVYERDAAVLEDLNADFRLRDRDRGRRPKP